jgi:UDP-N-acetylglucosamine 3-dehydrogenase
MKIGIISFAHLHAHSYANAVQKTEGIEIGGIYDDNEERGRQAAERYAVTYYSRLEDLLQSDVDAVIVTSENVKHREHVTAAAAAGKHILCEKPLATNKSDAEKMIEACNQHNVILQTAFPVRFNTSIQRAKSVIENGELGRILAIKATNRGMNPGGWFVDKKQSGGGAVIDHTVHVVDVLRWFMNSEVVEVYAEVDHMFSETVIDDCGILTMEFDNGAFATLDCSWSRNKTYPAWGDVTLEIVGMNGTLSLNAFSQRIHTYTNEEGYQHHFWGDDMDEGLIRDFAATVRENRQPSITGLDGLRAVEVAFAAYRSSEQKLPVTLR